MFKRSTNSRSNWNLCPVQTSCFCRAELNSGIKFDRSTAEARRLNQTFELSSARQLSSTSSAVLHDSGTAAIQTSCFCRATVEPNCNKFGTAEARRLNWALEMLVFEEGGEPEYPEKNPWSKDEN